MIFAAFLFLYTCGARLSVCEGRAFFNSRLLCIERSFNWLRLKDEIPFCSLRKYFYRVRVQLLLEGAKFTAACVRCARDQFRVHFGLFLFSVTQQCAYELLKLLTCQL